MIMINNNLYEKMENTDGTIEYKPYDITKITICGRNIEEVIQILNGLDLEKEKELTLTMENLGKWCELIKEDIKKQQEIAIKSILRGEDNDK